MTTEFERNNIPKPPVTNKFTAKVEEIEIDLMIGFRQAATYKIYEPADTLNKKT